MPSQLQVSICTRRPGLSSCRPQWGKAVHPSGRGPGFCQRPLHLLSVLFHRLNVQSMKPSFWETVRLSHMILVGWVTATSTGRGVRLLISADKSPSPRPVSMSKAFCTADQIRRGSKIIVNTETIQGKDTSPQTCFFCPVGTAIPLPHHFQSRPTRYPLTRSYTTYCPPQVRTAATRCFGDAGTFRPFRFFLSKSPHRVNFIFLAIRIPRPPRAKTPAKRLGKTRTEWPHAAAPPHQILSFCIRLFSAQLKEKCMKIRPCSHSVKSFLTLYPQHRAGVFSPEISQR